MSSPDKPAKCFEKGQELAINQSTVIAILIMLSIAGIQVFILLLRWSMITGWIELIRSKFSKNREFVSLDAKLYQDNNTKNYELKKFDQEEQNHLQYPQDVYRSPLGDERHQTDTPDYFNKETQRPYQSPEQSFSRPMSPPQEQIGFPRVDWDPRSTHARGGLGLHPPEFESKF
jgi:hypothetical protein